jgi:hypothetical protein
MTSLCVDEYSNFQFTISGMHRSLAKQDKLKQIRMKSQINVTYTFSEL